MKKLISTLLVVAMITASATSVFAGGRGGHHGGHGGGGLGGWEIFGIAAGAMIIGGALANASNPVPYRAPVQYVPAPQYAPAPMMYQRIQVRVQPPTYMRGTCFPSGAYFPDGVIITFLGYFPPGYSVQPGDCFQ